MATNYFFAIAIVMTGWLWLIAWIAMEMVWSIQGRIAAARPADGNAG
jgi:hypothetical protein